MKKPRVVIVGSGFGGVYTVKHLLPVAQLDELEIILINRTNYFLFTPLLHEVATGGLSPLSVIEPLREIFRHEPIIFRQAEVIKINPITNQVITKDETIDYDYLVLATGAQTDFHGVNGAYENSLTLKNLTDALKIRNQILDICETAAAAKDQASKRKLLTFAIVGGGPTGVEVAGEVAEFVKKTICNYYRQAGFTPDDVEINLFSQTTELLPSWPKRVRHAVEMALVRKGVKVWTGTAVKEVRSNQITLADGRMVPTSLIIWVAGVKPQAPEVDGVSYDPNGRIIVDEFLRAKNQENIFVLGDTACFESVESGSQPLPKLAQIATQQAKIVAKNIWRESSGKKLIRYRPMIKGMLISVGQWFGAGEIFGFYLEGRFMWWLWRTIYLFNFLSWRKRLKIAAEWTINLFYPRDISKII